MIPDYFHYLLSGQISNEYTNATTTALVNTETKDWDWELIKLLGLPEKIFMPILKPGKKIGRLSEEIEKEVGFSCDIVLPCTHDTGSAIAGRRTLAIYFHRIGALVYRDIFTNDSDDAASQDTPVD